MLHLPAEGRAVTGQRVDARTRRDADPAPAMGAASQSDISSSEAGRLPLLPAEELRDRDSNPNFLIQSQASYR